jgi:nitrite reductase/ring-hydroxylating ferredoxin subunit
MSTEGSPDVIDPDPALPKGFPMPMNASLLKPGAVRVRVRSKSNRFPFPVPNGWFAVAVATDVAPGQIRPVSYFGEDLIVYRTESGEPRTTDAYCPHLGAHIAVGGRVKGECVSCPFHGWTFDGSGQCVEIPYAPSERIPAKARLRSYPTIERNGMIWAWHHLEGGEPFYEIPVVTELGDPDWLPPQVIDFRIATSCQEISENHHDPAHALRVHGVDTFPEFNLKMEGAYQYVEIGDRGVYRETFGLGFDIQRIPKYMTYFSCATPVDRENVHVRWTFTAPISRGKKVLDQFVAIATSGYSQDLLIWENKAYRPQPVLTKGEVGIARFRKWSRQFYSVPQGELAEY